MLRIKKDLSGYLTSILAIPFLLILIFGFTMSFFDNLEVSDQAILKLIDIIYAAKKILLFACFGLCFLRKKIPLVSVFVALTVVLVIACTYLSSAQQFELFMDLYLDFFCGLVCFWLIFGGLVDVERLMSIAAMIGRILLVLCIASLLALPDMEYFVQKNYMDIANALMVPTAVLLYPIYRKGYWWDYILLAVGVAFILMYGSRGGFLTLVLLSVVVLYLKGKRKHSPFLLTILVLVAGIMFILESGVLPISVSRTLEKIGGGELFESSDRFEIWSYLISRSAANFLVGRGLCTDRLYLNELYNNPSGQVYAHNFFVEMLTDFGLIGLILGVALVVLLLYFFFRCENSQLKTAVLIFAFTSFLQLMFSRTFLSEPGFFIMLAILLRWQLFEKKTKGAETI